LRDLSREEIVLQGNAACAGCPTLIGLRIVGKALGTQMIMVVPACCTSVIESSYPKTSFKIPLLNIAFEATAACASGIRAGLKRLGKEDIQVVGWAGDGGTYDIGIQALSGAWERRTDFIYICYNNQIYSNTGIQRSGATPAGAWTTTTWKGKEEEQKDMLAIAFAHQIPYVASACVGYPLDFYQKLLKAKQIKGPRYIELLTPCPPGWRFDMSKTVEMGKLAVETGAWPLLEVEDGKISFQGISKAILDGKYKPKPIEDWLSAQGRFSHLFKPKRDGARINKIKETINEKWQRYREGKL
jgi:pyruvate ferredoxin oxidoreductase beta subunit